MARGPREGIFPVCSALVRPHLEHCIQLGGLQHRKALDLLEWVQRGHKCDQRDGVAPLWRQVREMGLLSLENRRLQEELIAAFQYLKGAYKTEGE